MDAIVNKVTLGDTSPKSPALVYQGALYLAWKGKGNPKLNVIYSTDYGRTFENKHTSNETTDEAPALCVHNGQVYIAWKGHNNDNLNVALVSVSDGVINGLVQKVVLDDTSPQGPSLASFNGRLYIAWRGKGNTHLNVMCSADNGHTFGHKHTSNETSEQAPSLAVHDGKLYITWAGVDNHRLNVAVVNTAGDAINGLSQKVVLGDTSPASPRLSSFNGLLYLAWRGLGNTHLNVMSSSDGGHSFGNKSTSAELSDEAPAICAYGRELAIAWAGVGNNQLNVAQAASALISGTLRPRYQVLSLIYAPPGTNGGKSNSLVNYGSGSATGATTSTSKSFKAGVEVTASGGIDIGIVKLGANAQFSYAKTTTDTSSFEIRKSQTSEIRVPGPSKDGIDHDHDQFVLWLNPLVNVRVDPQNHVQWGPGVDGPTMLLQYVYVGWLKNASLMPAGVRKELDRAGLTPSDYAQILALDPFASGGTALDPSRFLPTTHSFPYIPPYSATDSVPTFTDTMQSTVTTSSSHSVQTQTTVSATVSAGIKVVLDPMLKTTGTLQWTNTATTSSSASSTQSASVTVGGPAFGYGGPTDVLVYWDTMYSSFMFAFASEAPSAAGSLLDAQGRAVVHKAITLTAGGHTRSTFTDHRGHYRFYGVPAGQGTVKVDGRSFTTPTGPHVALTTLRFTP